MAVPFSHTLQALMADSLHRSRVLVAAVAIVMGAWSVWFFYADVGIYQTAPSRLQAEHAIHTVEATFDGRVIATHMTLGRIVRAGDILVELEHSAMQLKLAEHHARLHAAHAQKSSIEAGISAEQKALDDVRQAARMTEAETRLRYEQAEEAAKLAEEEAARWRRLRDSGAGAAEIQILEREATARRNRSEAQALQLAINRGRSDRRAAEADRQAGIERLRREAAELTGLIAATARVIEQIEHDRQNYILRAPVNGPLADVADLRPGMVVRSGERLATILPDGEVKVTADFPPGAMGHIKPGQAAAVRLTGFPVEQYGRVEATVRHVARESRNGTFHVELAIPHYPASIPLQHGLTGIVEIEVERISPALLILRSAGARVNKDAAGRNP